jgi:hypothetical protein
MRRSFIARYITPWAYGRERQMQQRVAALRERDGDNCRRCRRPIRFDLAAGHDKGPRIESIAAQASGEAETIENLCLCHGRCNAAGADNTSEVAERIRRKSEARLLSKKRTTKTTA